MSERFGAAVSEHPIAAHAVGEVVGQVLDAVGEAPQLALLFVTGQSAGALEDICQTVRATLRPTTLLGIAGAGIVGNQREVENAAAVSLWAGRVDTCVPLRFRTEHGVGDLAPPAALPGRRSDGTVLLLADPLTFQVEPFLRDQHMATPDVTVVGGLGSVSQVAGGNRLVLDDTLHTDGAVGVWMPPGVMAPLVSQGCLPVGAPYTVTAADGNHVFELGGRPALDRVREIAADEKASSMRSLHLGVVVDEHRLDFGRGDFSIQGMRMDPAAGGIVVDRAPIEVGRTVQFQVRDAATATEDLAHVLYNREAAGALVFTGEERGSRLFDTADHDAAMVSDALGGVPLAGVFCAGELGPIGRENHLHTFATSLALFS